MDKYLVKQSLDILEIVCPGITSDPMAIERARKMNECLDAYNELSQRLSDAHCKHADMVYSNKRVDGKRNFCIHISYLDTPKFKEKVLGIVRDCLGDKVKVVKETKTTVVYSLGVLE